VVTQEKMLLESYQQRLKINPHDLAAQYGYALELMNVNRFDAAETMLSRLVEHDPNNLFFVIGLAEAEANNSHATVALARLEALRRNYPDNYAVIIAYAECLTAANKTPEAIIELNKATRLFPKDLSLCKTLARTHAKNHRNDFAYFTQARCYVLQGQGIEAKRMLKQAQRLVKKDPMLRARISASLDELRDD
jgi:predicted Zn-dependent protease